MKGFFALFVLALAMAATTDASSRLDTSALSLGSLDFSKLLGGAISGYSGGLPAKRPNEDEKAVVLIEYAVLPPVQEKFVEIFKALQDKTEKEPGVKVFGLSRTIDQNLNFYLYSEWESQKAYGDHFGSDYVKEYLEAIAKIGVVWKLHFLDQITFIKPGQE